MSAFSSTSRNISYQILPISTYIRLFNITDQEMVLKTHLPLDASTRKNRIVLGRGSEMTTRTQHTTQ